METSYVELQEIPVLRVKADMKGKGPSAAFNLLESKLPTIKGRKFYGTFQFKLDGEEYYACAARIDSDDPGAESAPDRNRIEDRKRRLENWYTDNVTLSSELRITL